MIKPFALTGVVSLLYLFSPVASAGLLGVAENYNVFLSGDMSSTGSDTEGRLAAGGNVTLQNYSVGLLSAPTEYSLVSGGSTSYGSGSVKNGGVFTGGNLDIHR